MTKFLFLFEINPPNKILKCIPMKAAIIIIAIISTVLGLINFSGVVTYGNIDTKSFWYYIYYVIGFLAPLALLYTAFKEDNLTASIALYFHTLFVIFAALTYILLIIFGLCVFSHDLLKELTGALIYQFFFVMFNIYFNYVFTCFEIKYSEIMNNAANEIAPNSQTTAYERI